MKNVSCLTLDEAWYEACGTLHSTVLILLMLPISSDGWQAQVCQGRGWRGVGGCQRGLLTRAIKYEIFKSAPTAGRGGVAGGTRRAFVQLAKNFEANKGVTKGGKEGQSGGLQVKAATAWLINNF